MTQILIVEDEDVIRTGLVYTIDWLSMGAVIEGTAATGSEGLRKIRELKPDIVITDIRMPVMNGLDMIRLAKEQGLSFIPILLTSYSDFGYARQAIELHVFEYIVKPVDDSKLSDVIKRAKIQLDRDRKYQSLSEADVSDTGRSMLILKTVSENPYINRCLKCIEKEYSLHPSIERLAAELKVSPSYLSRLFKKTTSLTFLDFLNRYRVQKAVELLSLQKYKVYEVALMSGFSEYKRFYEVFRSYTGIPPTGFVQKGCCMIKR